MADQWQHRMHNGATHLHLLKPVVPTILRRNKPTVNRIYRTATFRYDMSLLVSTARGFTKSRRHVHNIPRLPITPIHSQHRRTISNLTHSHKRILNTNNLRTTQIPSIKTSKNSSAPHDPNSPATSTMNRCEYVCRLCSLCKVL